MKKHLSLAIFVMAVATIVSVALVSCKKDNENALLGKNNETSKSFDMRQIDDMSAYLKNFRQKMLEGKDCETLNLEDAAWHLASLMNYEHCNINVHFDDVRFDTLDMQINVTDGCVLMSDLREAYEQTWPIIKKFQDGLGLDNQNLRFVNMFISEDGNASIIMMTTFFSEEKDLDDHLWYFPNENYLDSIYDYYFDEYASYLWNYGAVRKLTTVINVIEGNRYDPSHPQSSNYTPTRIYTFYYNYWIDPYGSPFYYNSRLFSHFYNTIGIPDYYLDQDAMRYCLDSYSGLAYQWLNDNPSGIDGECPVYWAVIPEAIINSNIICHKLTVQYGSPNLVGPGPDPN